MNTHSRNADSRAELMAASALRAGAGLPVLRQILDSITTEQCVDLLLQEGILQPTMEQILGKIEYYLGKRAGDQMQVGAVVFSSVHGELGRTGNADSLCRLINKNREE